MKPFQKPFQISARLSQRRQQQRGPVHGASVSFSPQLPLLGPPSPSTPPTTRRRLNRSATTDTWIYDLPTDEQLELAYQYPNPTLRPQFGRRHTSFIAISGAIGTGLFLGSGTSLHNAGPLGILLGYIAMSTVVYGFIVSSAEMVAAFPYCRGTVGLADRFVDPALGFAMGWNAWYHWGIIIPSQVSAAMALLKYWNPSSRLVAMWPVLFTIGISVPVVLGARWYREVESIFASMKICTIVFLLIYSLYDDIAKAVRGENPFQYWKHPFQEYLNIHGSLGKVLGFFAVFFQAAISFFGTEIPLLIAGEVRDAPVALPAVARRVWIRITAFYILSVLAAGTLVSPDQLATVNLPDGKENDAPWVYSPFLTALNTSGSGSWVTSVCIALFMFSAASAASTEVFVSSRYLYYLAKAGHAPKFFGKVWPNTDRAKENGTVVPWVGVLTTTLFSLLSFISMRPHENTMSGHEKMFQLVLSMTSAACLQAWVGTLWTYLRYYRGTMIHRGDERFSKDLQRLEKEVRAWGQPYLAIYSFVICILVLTFNGWSLFNSENGKWVIFWTPEQGEFPRDQVIKFITTYLPIPLFLVLLFGYKLIKQSTFIRSGNMNFSGIAARDADVEGREYQPEWNQPLKRIWWILVM